MQRIWLTIFWVAVMADLATQRQVPARPIAELRIPYATYFFSFSSLQPFRRHHFSQSTPILAGSSSNKRQYLKAPSILVPTPVFKSATNSVLGRGLLEGRVRHGRFASSRPRYRRCFEGMLAIKRPRNQSCRLGG